MGDWGPRYWRFIHFFAVHGRGRDMFQALTLPCINCKYHYVPPTDDEDLAEWSLGVHNAVNVRRGVPEWTMDQLVAEYSKECTHQNWSMDNFPWNFMFHVALTKNGTVDFFKQFSDQYPCSECKLLHDEPRDGEDMFMWIKRNWKRASGQPEETLN